MKPRLLFALALLVAQPAFAGNAYVAAPARNRIAFDEGVVFYADYMADYWSRPGADTRGDTPDADAPGDVVARPARFGGDLKQVGAAEISRKLYGVFPRLLAHPALAGIRGSSLRPGGSIGRRHGGPMGYAVSGQATLIAYPITLRDPATIKYAGGTYHTPGEGPSLNITVNDTQELEGREPIGTWKGMTVLRGGYMLVVPNTDRPLYVRNHQGRLELNPGLIDISRPRSDIQFMTIYVGTSSSEAGEIVHRRVRPTGNTGRLVGVLYNTDWEALLQEINQLR